MRSLPLFLGFSGHRDVYGIVSGGARGVWWGFLGCLGFAFAVGRADLEGVLARTGVPVVDVLAPGVYTELGGESGLVPGLAAVCRDLDLLDALVRGPGDAADGVLAGGEVVAVFYG